MIKCPDQKGANEEEFVMPGGGDQTAFFFFLLGNHTYIQYTDKYSGKTLRLAMW